jgi:hypothetical protein
MPASLKILAKITEVFNNKNFTAEMTTLISDYVGKVDTQLMISNLLSGIPNRLARFEPVDIQHAQADDPDSLGWLSGTVPKAAPGAILLKMTAERKLTALSYLFCNYHDVRAAVTYQGPDRAIAIKLLQNEPCEPYEFFDRIQGTDIVERCDFRTNAQLCHTFVFSEEIWFSEPFVQRYFYRQPFTQTLEFLEKKGYRRAATPAKGQIVMYCDHQYPHHFAKVDEVDAQGDVIVVSKHGQQHIYRHRIENAIARFGFQYFCLWPPEPA